MLDSIVTDISLWRSVSLFQFLLEPSFCAKESESFQRSNGLCWGITHLQEKETCPLSQLTLTGQEKPHFLTPHFGCLCDWSPEALSMSVGARSCHFYPGLMIYLRELAWGFLGFLTPPLPCL